MTKPIDLFKGKLRNAYVTASVLEILCPYCQEPQPNPDDGSQMWSPSQMHESQGERKCVACNKQFRLMSQNRVSVPRG